MTTYADYQRDRIGWFFGLSGGQLMFLALASLPAFWAISRGAWFSAFLFALVWLFLLAITVIPVRGRSATGWVFASTMYAVGGLLGWTSFRAKATQGRAEDLDTPDLPGVLQGIQIHDGPPHGSQLQRVAIIQDHATKTWAVTASIVHPGIGMKDTEERSRYGEALAGLLDVAGRTEKVDEILFMVRTVPEDGAERDLWVNKHRRANAPELSEVVNSDLAHGLTQASVRTEQFVTIVVPETRIARSAKESGGGFEGRCRELYLLMAEIEAQLRGPDGDDVGALAHHPRARPGVPDRVRPRRPRRHRRGPRAAGEGPERQRRRPVGAGRTLGRRRDGAALQPRRVELDQRHHQAAHPRRRRWAPWRRSSPRASPVSDARSSSPTRSCPSPRPTGSPATPSGPPTWPRG